MIRRSGLNRFCNFLPCARILSGQFAVALLIAVFALSSNRAKADTPGLAPPAVHQVIDENGVNLTSGRERVKGPSITIGVPGQGGLTYTPEWQGRGWESNLQNSVSYNSSGLYTVVVMGKSTPFSGSPSTGFTPADGMGASLVKTGSNYIYTGRDGTVAVFDGSNTFSYALLTIVGLPSTITYPSGEILTFTNQVVSSLEYYLLSVNSNRGYQLKIFYNSSHFITQVVALNNAIDYCSPTASSCSFSQTWPTLTYSYPSSPGGSSTAITDSNGNTTTGKWDASVLGRIEERVTFPSGRYLSYLDTDLDNYIDTVTDGVSSWQYVYTLAGAVTTRVTDPTGRVREVTTDSSSGAMTLDAVDPSGANLRTSYSYDLNNRVTQITYPEFNVTQFTYDSRGNITQRTEISKTPGTPANIVTTASYPSSCSNPLTCNKPTSTTDANSNTTDYIYDSSHGGILTVTGPAVGGVRPQTSYTYDPKYAWYRNGPPGPLWGAAVWNSFNWTAANARAPTPIYVLTQTSKCMTSSSCGGASQESLLSYSYVTGSSAVATNLLPASISSAAGDGSLTATVTTTFDSVGNIASVDGPIAGSSDTTVFFYDADRNQIGMVSPDPDGGGSLANPAIKTSYDADSRVLEVQNGTVPSQTKYDFDNNFTSLTQMTNGYDSVTGAKIGVASALGGTVQSITQYSFDAARNPLCTAVRQNTSLFGSVSAPFGSLPVACSQPTSMSDLISHNNYDPAGRLTSTEVAYGTGSQQTDRAFSYTDNGKVAWVEDARQNRSAYTYDGLDRLTQLNFPSPSTSHTPSSTDYEQYGYDSNGNLTSKRLRSTDTIAYSYDALNRKTYEHPSTGTDIYYAYNLVGNPIYAHYSSTGGSGVDYTWDALGRKLTETSYGRTVSSQYDLAGNRTRLTYPDSNYIQYSYDILNRMQQVQQNGSAVMVAYSYDNLGRISAINRNNSATVGKTTNTFNSTSQSWSMEHSGLSQNVIYSMTYTPAAQQDQRTISNSAYAYGAPSLSQSYTANGLNQYSSATGTYYSHDGRGNLTCVSTGASCTGTVSKSYSYDLENRLIGESTSSTTIGYDPVGRMQQTAVSSTTEQYLYDDNDLIVEYDGSGNILRRYVPGQGADQPLIWYEGSNLSSPHWLHTDQQGSIIATSDSSGTATPYSYSVYGDPSGGWGSSPATPIFRYTGQVALAAVRLYYYKARMYDPALGRFLQTDPVGYSAGLNLYAYVNNDPVNATDPNGMDAQQSTDHCMPVGDDSANPWACSTEPVESVTVTATRLAVNGGASSSSHGSRGPDFNDPGPQTVSNGTNNSLLGKCPLPGLQGFLRTQGELTSDVGGTITAGGLTAETVSLGALSVGAVTGDVPLALLGAAGAAPSAAITAYGGQLSLVGGVEQFLGGAPLPAIYRQINNAVVSRLPLPSLAKGYLKQALKKGESYIPKVSLCN